MSRRRFRVSPAGRPRGSAASGTATAPGAGSEVIGPWTLDLAGAWQHAAALDILFGTWRRPEGAEDARLNHELGDGRWIASRVIAAAADHPRPVGGLIAAARATHAGRDSARGARAATPSTDDVSKTALPSSALTATRTMGSAAV